MEINMEKKFTPGEWFINENSFDCGEGKLSVESKINGESYFIAQVDREIQCNVYRKLGASAAQS